MKYLVIAAILMMAYLTGCQTENPAADESSVIVSKDTTLIVGEGSTVVIGEGVDIEKQPDKPLFVNQISQDVIHKRHCRVGDTVTIEAVVSKGGTALRLGLIYLETGHNDVEFVVDVYELLPMLVCEDYYKDGEIYEFTLFIRSIELYAEQLHVFPREDPPIFEIGAELILTEKLAKDIREAGCWHDEVQLQ